MKGLRKLAFGGAGLLALGLGFWAALVHPDAGKVAFPAYATAVVSIVGAVVLGNVGEWAAKRGQP